MTESELQREIIKKQQREINSLRASNRVLEATSQTLAEALSQALTREGRDRVFVPVREIKPLGTAFRMERTIDNDIIVIRA